MISYNSVHDNFKATFQADSAGAVTMDMYARSKSMLNVQRLDEEKMTLFGIYYSSLEGITPTVWYYSDPQGRLGLPLRNGVNFLLNRTNCAISILMREVDNSTTIDELHRFVNPLHGISYHDIFAPRSKDAPQLYWEHEHYVVLPPNVIINPLHFSGGAGQGVIVESNYAEIDTDSLWQTLMNGAPTIAAIGGERNAEITIIAAADTLRLTAGKDGKQVKEWTMTRTDDCTNLVCVQWMSHTGALRRHYFPIVSFIKGNDKQVSLLSNGDGYLVDKNTFDAIRCRLDGLTAYGYWYYMDLLQASDVHAVVQLSFVSLVDQLASEQSAAYVEKTEDETPQGNGFHSFEFTLKLRHYGSL